jgi:hypothetical protein
MFNLAKTFSSSKKLNPKCKAHRNRHHARMCSQSLNPEFDAFYGPLFPQIVPASVNRSS